MIRKYHNHKPQTTPWHREEEPLNPHETPGRQIKQSKQLSLPHQDDCNTRMDIKYFRNHLEEEEKVCCFAIIVLQMYYLYNCSEDLPHGAVGWSAVCDCGIF